MTLHNALVPIMLAAMTACAPPVQRPAGVPAVDSRHVAIDVANDHWSAVTVFLVRAGERHRLGDINGSATEHFYVPALLFDAPVVRLRVEPRDRSAPYDSELLMAEPGQRVAFRIGPDMAASLRIR
ncbi:MAG TPA: hypothetical protein VLN49_08585 [Gemmatimonadaceae bacterium]|nr:hypothetical protein [Gemmatimonadaceae bacterium]